MSADCLIGLYRNSDARALLEAVGQPPSGALLAHWKLDESKALGLPASGKARQLLNEALDLATAARDSRLICLVCLRLGLLAELDSKSEESAARYRAALAAAANDAYLRARALGDLGYSRLRASRFDEAITILSQALDAARSCGAKGVAGNIYGNMGWCYFKLGDVERAVRLLNSAASLTDQVHDIGTEQWWLQDLGVCYRQRHDLVQAADLQRRAAGLAHEANYPHGEAAALTGLAETLLQKGDAVAARPCIERALAVFRSMQETKDLAYSELVAARIKAAMKDPAAAAAYQAVLERAHQAGVPLVTWEAHAALAGLYHTSQRLRQAEPEYQEAIATIDSEWDKLTGDSKLTFLTNLIEFFQDYVDFLVEQNQPAKALEMAESSRARVLNQRLKGQHQIPATSSLDKLLRAAQASHTVILSYWLAPHRSLVWVIAGGRLRYFELPPRDVIAKQVATYSQSVQQAEDPLAGGGAAGGALYDELLGKAQALIPPGANVIVIPDGELHQLNFETLIVSKPQPHYWIEDIAGVSVAPSLRVLTGEFRKQPRAPKLLLIGNPVQASKDYSALPNASREVAAVEAHFPPGQTVLTGAAAVPACYAKSANDSFTTIHFSAHATANYESPLNSAIILSPEGDKYMLFAREAAGVHVGADLVTVSACRSAGSKAYAGEGLMGFAWAFLGAGARHVIAGLWDLDEAAAVPLMDRLYAEMAAGQTPARALHAAKLALIRSSGRHQRPYFWGPLEVFTRGLGN